MMQPDAPISHPIRWISVEFAEFRKLSTEAIKFYNEKVQPLFANAKLIEMLAINSEYDKFASIIQKNSFLNNLSEETLWNEYRGGLLIAGKKPFSGFSKENTEAFYRLKLRSIESRLPNYDS